MFTQNKLWHIGKKIKIHHMIYKEFLKEKIISSLSDCTSVKAKAP
jgi:hypothetical protein